MIKFAVAALWIAFVTLGAVYWGARTRADSGAAAQAAPPMMGGLDYVKTEIISVPVVREGAVAGYFLARFVYTAEPAKLAKLSIPADVLLTDAVYTHLYGRTDVHASEIDAFDIEAFRQGLRESINARVGDTLVHDVLVEQVDFLTKDDIRNNSLRRRESKPAKDAAPPGGPGGGDAHAAESH